VERDRPKQWEGWAHAGTVASAAVAVVALLVGAYQFFETTKLQREALVIQATSAKAERSSKAAEFFERFVQSQTEWDPPKEKNRIDHYIRVRNNKSLQLLNALFTAADGNEKWEMLVFWELQKLAHFIKKRETACLSLTDDFYQFILKSVTELPPNICYDTYDSE
jgi:hypothetical protein